MSTDFWLFCFFLSYFVASHLDRRGRGSVFHLWWRMVCYRRSIKNILHQNIQRLRGAKTDSMFAGREEKNILHIAYKCPCNVMMWFFFLLIRLFSHPITRAQPHPSTRSSKSVCLWKCGLEVICWIDRTTSHSKTHSSFYLITPCLFMAFVVQRGCEGQREPNWQTAWKTSTCECFL